jgi:hypothetical protein
LLAISSASTAQLNSAFMVLTKLTAAAGVSLRRSRPCTTVPREIWLILRLLPVSLTRLRIERRAFWVPGASPVKAVLSK